MHEHHFTEKGWTTEELGKVKLTYEKLDKERTAKHIVIDMTIFVLLLAFAVTLNAALGLLILPLFLFFPTGFLAIVLIVSGIAFGVLFAYLSKDMHRGHMLFMVASAILSLLVFGYILKSANQVEQLLGGAVRDTFLYAAGYVLSYILPFILIHPRRDHAWT